MLGDEGVGRKSLSRLSAYLAGLPLFEVDSSRKGYNLNSWRQDLKTAMLTVGLEHK